jgi:hypothetical protein
MNPLVAAEVVAAAAGALAPVAQADTPVNDAGWCAKTDVSGDVSRFARAIPSAARIRQQIFQGSSKASAAPYLWQRPARCHHTTAKARPPARVPLTTKGSDNMRKAILAAVAAVAATSPFTASRRWHTRSHAAPPGMPSVPTARGARRLHSMVPTAQSPAGRSTSGWSAKKMSTGKMAAGLAAAALTMGIVPLLPAPVASAGPCTGYPSGGASAQIACAQCALGNYARLLACGYTPPAAPPRQTQAPPSRVPVQTPQAPPTHAPPPSYAPPSTVPVQTPEVKPPPPPSTVPVVTPKINPPGTGAPRNAALVKPPKGLDASPEAIEAAKSAPAARIEPAAPPRPPTQVDFRQQVLNLISTHNSNSDIDVVKVDNRGLVRPRHWDWVDYDVDHRPTLYNPLTEAMTFRYFYDGAYRDVYVAAGARVVLDVATVGVFPFTAVGDNYLTSGSFYGGAPPEVYQDVSADVPADDQTVQLGQVTVLGHDDSQPAGSQDTFMIDDGTLAWGQVNDPGSPTQITVTKTQSLPGVGPTDNGSFLVALTAQQQPSHDWKYNWSAALVVLAGGVLAGVATWVIIKRPRGARRA